MLAIYFDLMFLTASIGTIVAITLFGTHWPWPH
jgi:hypothetical protein